MYAVIETGGKQYRVQPGDVVQVEKLAGEVGQMVEFKEVLLLSKPGDSDSQVWLGKPFVSNAKVSTQIVAIGRGEKILMIKRRRRKNYRRTKGHRQEFVQLLVTAVDNGAGEKAALSADETQKKTSSFFSLLKPRGLERTPKTLGSRLRMAEKAGKPTPKKAERKEAKAVKVAAKVAKASAKAAPKKTTKKKTAKKKATTKK